MRELILLRHAHAEPAASGQDDHQRGLSATGRAEAQAAGEWLREHGLRPDRVLCSDAARTRDTLAALGDIGAGEVYEDASIYEASPGTLAALADANARLRPLVTTDQRGGDRVNPLAAPPAVLAVLVLVAAVPELSTWLPSVTTSK